MNPLILTQQVEDIAILTLNRPERHNSLVPELLEALIASVEDLGTQPNLRVVILQANGRSFSTGGDLQGFADHLDDIADYANGIVGLLNQSILTLMELPMPVVAAVQGMVTGGSLGLVLACDVILVTPATRFTPFYTAVGFSPDGGWTALLPHVIGSKRAAEVLMGNRTITGEQALAWGLANRTVSEEKLHEVALTTAQELASGECNAQREIKRLLLANYGDFQASLDMERAQFVEQIKNPDTHKRMLAFLEKM